MKNMYVCMYVCMICVYACVRAYIYIYIYIYIWDSAQTRVNKRGDSSSNNLVKPPGYPSGSTKTRNPTRMKDF